MAGLIVLGSVVRTTGSGLACPDWPLCEGRLIPRLESHVLIEWSHRLVALLVSTMLLVTVGWTLAHAPVRRRLGGLVTLAVALLFVQILLGALTVWKLLSPTVVSSHLAVAVLLFATLLVVARVASASADVAAPQASRAPGVLPLFATVTAAVYAQIVLGGIVSTSQAGLACPDWPTCRGEWFPPMQGLVGLQQAHRLGAYTVAALVVTAWFASRRVGDRTVRLAATSALHLVLVQVVVGVSNVLLGTPPAVSALHLAVAAGLLASMIVASHRLGGLPVVARGAEPAAMGQEVMG
jgi:cytochrome c oxidase assembly protein subunit 15